jgi:hypothetical protein
VVTWGLREVKSIMRTLIKLFFSDDGEHIGREGLS